VTLQRKHSVFADKNNTISKMSTREIIFTDGSSSCKSKAKMLLNHTGYMVLMIAVTVFALFGDDLKTLLFPKSVDIYFDVLTLLAIVLFAVEVILTSIYTQNYFCGFFFWMDVIAPLAMVFEVGLIFSLSKPCEDALDILQITRVATVTRIIRFIRLMRLFKIVKAYKDS
jgi:hypothetical protein